MLIEDTADDLTAYISSNDQVITGINTTIGTLTTNNATEHTNIIGSIDTLITNNTTEHNTMNGLIATN